MARITMPKKWKNRARIITAANSSNGIQTGAKIHPHPKYRSGDSIGIRSNASSAEMATTRMKKDFVFLTKFRSSLIFIRIIWENVDDRCYLDVRYDEIYHHRT